MDDLLGEDWQSSSRQPTLQPHSSTVFTTNNNVIKPLQQPISSATIPLNLNRPSNSASGPKSSLKSSNDAFQGLSGLTSLRPANSGVSIQERQQQLAEERARHLKEQGSLLDSLGSRSQSRSGHEAQHSEVDDILAAFNKDAKVDRSSHFPPPSLPPSDPTSRQGTPAGAFVKQGPSTLSGGPNRPMASDFDEGDDDDTFGLNGLSNNRKNGHVPATRAKTTSNDDDDDLLGDLGRPVQTRITTTSRTHSPADSSDEHWDENVAKTQSARHKVTNDAPLAELLEMGFPEDTAKIALAENGGDVNRAVGWLLQQAHAQSKREIQEQRGEHGDRSGRSPVRRSNDQARSNGRPQDPPEKDAAQMAQEFGSRFLKSAGSLWKAGQKQMAKTVAEFQQERDPAQPKWMQNGTNRQSNQLPERDSKVTNEAALLDMPREDQSRAPRAVPTMRERSPRSARPVPQPRAPERGPAAKLRQQDIDEQSAQAYVSPARRRQVKPKPEPIPEPEVDLFSPAPVQPKTRQTAAPQQSGTRASSIPARAEMPPRTIPAVSSIAIASAIRHRNTGTDAFKRGDYGAAHDAYTAAIQALPATHPLLIVLLSNRSLTALKTGDPKIAISDADRALELIGPTLGINETIDLGGSEPAKDMREFYGKALMRKAEALEHMEKWNEAASVWRLAVEAGVGGAVSIRGRDRCEKAASPPSESKAAAIRAVKKPAASKPPAAVRPVRPVQVSDTAVKKLREANAAAERADDEKFQLTDVVDARLTSWKGGKADNLRALLQSLDAVLWESAGWKSVGMSDLVMPNKVKIIYMKAIAKVHPDKIAQDATTEQRMISSAVFSTLNEAWDKFKKDNNM